MAAYIPPCGFYFRVEFIGIAGMDNDTEQRFQEVNGLSVEIEIDELREGGQNRFTYKLPKRAKYPNLILKRGLLKGTKILDWVKAAQDSYFNAFSGGFQPADIIITLMDEAGEETAVWNVVQAYPLKMSTSDFKASDNSIVVETIELAYQYFTRK